LEIKTKVTFKLKHLKRDSNQWSFYVLAIGLFISIPALSILFYLFNGVGEMWQHITTYFLFDYIKNSVILILGTSLLSFSIGTSAAWIVCKYDFRFRSLIESLLFLPLAIPSYIMAYTYVGLLGYQGLLIGWLQAIGLPLQKIEMMNIQGLIWVLSFSLFPYVYVGAKTMFISFPKVIQETATLLGASSKRYFFRIALPLASPAIIGGLFLVIMEVLNDYGAAKYFGINTFTTGIFRTWTALEDIQSAIYLSAILVALVFLLNILVKWYRRKKSYALRITTLEPEQRKRVLLSGKKKYVYYSILLIPVLFGFLLPVIQLLYWGYLTFHTMFNTALLTIALQSLFVGGVAAFFIVTMSIMLVYFSRWNNLKYLNFFKRIATIGYVIPGAIIGIGIIRSSQSIINFFSDYIGLNIGFLFYGSSVVLIYAYIFRFLAVSYNPIEANSLKFGKYLSESSYLLASSKIKTLFKIELPLLRYTLVSSFLLVFVDILKELPLTLILKPYKLQTLATKSYEYADDERVAEAAIPALLLIAIISCVMIFVSYWNKINEKSPKEANRFE
jgi:iron(III) transport system permease protein